MVLVEVYDKIFFNSPSYMQSIRAPGCVRDVV